MLLDNVWLSKSKRITYLLTYVLAPLGRVEMHTDAVFAVGMKSEATPADTARTERRTVTMMCTSKVIAAPVASRCDGHKTRDI